MIKVGIDIGGTNIKFGYFYPKEKKWFSKIKTPKEKNLILEAIVKQLKTDLDIKKVKGYTVCIPGVMIDNVVTYAPNTDIVGLNIYDYLSKELHNKNIIIENDANLQALAESKASKLKDLILLTLGTGFGGGIIIDGKLLNKNGYAGEVGHIKVDFSTGARTCGCGKKGCAEAYVSARAIVKDYNERHNSQINSLDLFNLAKQNDEEAILEIKKCARYLAITISDIIAVLGIKNVRLAGGLSSAGEDFIKYVRKYYPEYCVLNMEDIDICQATLNYEAGVWAAYYLI